MASVTWFVALHYEHRITGPLPCHRVAATVPVLYSLAAAVGAQSYWPCSATAWLCRRLCLIRSAPSLALGRHRVDHFQLGS